MNASTNSDSVDQLLGDYFKSQLPARWPSAPRAGIENARPSNGQSSGEQAARSRWALAASVAILIGGCWYLSGHFDQGQAKKGLNLEDGSADAKILKAPIGKAKAVPQPTMP